jgi:hypothetical protein
VCRHRVSDGVDVTTQVDGDDVSAFLGQPHSVTAALAARRTRDECDFSLYPAFGALYQQSPFRCFGRR